MAVKIRLRRIGKNPKKRPHFRISVFEETQGRDARCLEELGYYSPVTGKVVAKLERINWWVKNGAQLSQTLVSLLKKAKKE